MLAEACAPSPFHRKARVDVARADELSFPKGMLWYVGSFFLAFWLFEKFSLHKGGFIHTLLLAAIGFFTVQFIQDQRTRAYEREARRDESR